MVLQLVLKACLHPVTVRVSRPLSVATAAVEFLLVFIASFVPGARYNPMRPNELRLIVDGGGRHDWVWVDVKLDNLDLPLHSIAFSDQAAIRIGE